MPTSKIFDAGKQTPRLAANLATAVRTGTRLAGLHRRQNGVCINNEVLDKFRRMSEIRHNTFVAIFNLTTQLM